MANKKQVAKKQLPKKIVEEITYTDYTELEDNIQLEKEEKFNNISRIVKEKEPIFKVKKINNKHTIVKKIKIFSKEFTLIDYKFKKIITDALPIKYHDDKINVQFMAIIGCIVLFITVFFIMPTVYNTLYPKHYDTYIPPNNNNQPYYDNPNNLVVEKQLKPMIIVKDNSSIINNSSIITKNDLPTITPKPITATPTPKPNVKHYDEFNLIESNGLSTDYNLKPNQQYKIGDKININMAITNFKDEPLTSLTGTMTISTHRINNADNQPSLPFTWSNQVYYENNLNIKKYDSHQIIQSIEIPQIVPKGTYLIILNVNGDNGGNTKIQQLITIN